MRHIAVWHSWHWKTNQQLKVAILERLRDFVHTDMLHVRSRDLLDEMRSITREGDSIEAAKALLPYAANGV